eukprot:86057_1
MQISNLNSECSKNSRTTLVDHSIITVLKRTKNMIRFIVLIVSIYHINGQAISCSTNPAAECAAYSAIPEVQGVGETGICDTEIGQCTVTCANVDICTIASGVVGIPLICTSGICAPPPTLDPTESTTDPSVSPTANTLAPSSTPSKSPVPGTAAPT